MVGGFLVVDGVYGFVSSAVDLAAAMNWHKTGVAENVNSLARMFATVVAPGNAEAQRAADAVSLMAGFVGGRMIVQPLMFSTRKITATSHMSPAAQNGLSAYSLLQAWDAGQPAATILKEIYQQK